MQWLATAWAYSPSLIGIRIRRVGRFCELVLQFRPNRYVEVQSLGRDLLREPFVVDLLAFAARIERGGGGIDRLLESRIVLAQHDAVGLRLGERVLGDDIL